MTLTYREDKAAQAAARLLLRAGGSINHMKLIKLLYLADRKTLLQWGRPITFDWYVSMKHGPVLSFTLNKINEDRDPEAPSYWQEVVSERENHTVRLLKNPPPNDQLSPAEETALDEIWTQFGKMSQWDLRDFSHTLPEWRDPQGSSLPIQLRDIFLGEGYSEDDVRDVLDTLEAEEFAAKIEDE